MGEVGGESALPDVAVVVLNWNGISHTRRCLAALQASDYRGRVSVLVVDNGSHSPEATALATEFPEVHVIALPRNIGYGEGCNTGIAKAHASLDRPYVLLLNNDATVGPSTLTELVEFMQSTPDAGAASPLILFSDSRRVWSAGGTVSFMLGSAIMRAKGQDMADVASVAPVRVSFAPGACLLLSPRLPESARVFDSRYFAYWEDVDLCFRMREVGFECYVVPWSLAHHVKSASTGAPGDQRFSPLVSYYLARNAFFFGRDHLTGARHVVFTLSQLLVRAPYMLLRRTSGSSRRSYLAGIRDGLLRRSGERETSKTA